MRIKGDPARLSIREIAALCERADAVPTRPFVARLLADSRAGARSLGAVLARRLDATARENERQARMLELERRCWGAGLLHVAGVDEAGMGPLAGPVVAAAVILSPEHPISSANDSKQLPAAERKRLDAVIRAESVGFAIGIASVEEMSQSDIYRAGLLAMRRAVLGLTPAPEHVLVDARTIPDLPMSQEAHVRGDARSCSIAAASILAKVHRDRLMADLALVHPGYGFETHAGYGTPEHLDALRRLGPCAAHRMSWRAVADFAGELSQAYYALKEELAAALRAGNLDGWRIRVQQAASMLTTDEIRRLDELGRRGARPRRRRGEGQMTFDAAAPEI
jgi:ribonuclease HII